MDLEGYDMNVTMLDRLGVVEGETSRAQLITTAGSLSPSA